MDEPIQFNKAQRAWILLGITAIGAFLRFYKLDFQSLWYDELHSIIPTAPQESISSIIQYCKSDQPPAFFLYLHFFFKLFGYSEVAGRAAAAVLGTLAIPACYRIVREFGGKNSALMSALLVAVNYFHIYYSQELRFYSMTFLFTVLSYLFFIRAFKNNRLKDFAGYAATTVILLYTHYYGLVIFGVQVLTFFVLIIAYRRDTGFILYGFLSGILTVLCFLPWIPVILQDLGISNFWIKKPSPAFILDYFYSYFGKDVLTTIILVSFTVFFFRSCKQEKPDHPQRPLYVIVVLWLVLSYLVPYVKSIFGVPMLHIRYTIISLPAWVMIFALGWGRIPQWKWKYALVIIVVLSSVLNVVFFRRHYSKITKQQFRESSLTLQERDTSDYPVFSGYPWHFNFYFRNSDQKVRPISEVDTTTLEGFWILQVEFFGPEDNQRELQQFSGTFDIAESHLFHGTAASCLIRRRP